MFFALTTLATANIVICHGTVALNNSTAIEIYCPPELMPEHTFDDWFRDWKEADAIYI